MRIFVYKLLISLIAIFFLYHLTIGYTIYSFKNKIYSSIDKSTIDNLKEKLREEAKSSLKKDKILKDEDALLIKRLMKKINSEINK
tara:strand:+ start:4091 stop:4348 length:258 start_codon:yes stop_codon:yes gene_type:complete